MEKAQIRNMWVKVLNRICKNILTPSLQKLKRKSKKLSLNWVSPGGSGVKNPPANAGDMGSIPGSGISPGEGNGNPLQDSCLGNPMDRGAWWGYSPWGHKRVGHNLVTK